MSANDIWCLGFFQSDSPSFLHNGCPYKPILVNVVEPHQVPPSHLYPAYQLGVHVYSRSQCPGPHIRTQYAGVTMGQYCCKLECESLCTVQVPYLFHFSLFLVFVGCGTSEGGGCSRP